MSYIRVIPRDFFNESKLLKCMGRLSLMILNNLLPRGIDIEMVDTGSRFQIEQDWNDGGLFISNYPVKVNGEIVRMKSNYNSKLPYPLYCEVKYGEEFLTVFDNNGEFDREFINFFKKV